MSLPESDATGTATNNKSNEGQSQQGGAARPRLLLVDGHALVYRAYHALPADLRTSRGEPTNAVLGFTQMLVDTLRKETPDYAVVTFDVGRTFRHEAAPDYKAQRGPMPGDLSEQFGRVRQVVEALGLPIVELAGYEADDLIGTLSREAERRMLDTYILTADTDQHQLVTDHVYMIAPGGYNQRFSDARVYDKAAVQERYGFEPKLVPDFKALVGDKTDNIPNVPTIGKETASRLLQKYGSLEGIIEHIDELKPRQQESLREHAEQALKSKELATIVCDAPVQLDLEHSHVGGFDRVKMLRLLQELEFSSLVGKVNALEQALSGVAPHVEPQEESSAQASPTSPAARTGGPHQANMFGDQDAAAPEGSPPAIERSDEKHSPASALGVAEERIAAGVPERVHVVTSSAELKALTERLTLEGRFTIDVEATSADDMDAQLVGIAIAPCDEGDVTDGYYIPVAHLESQEGVEIVSENQLSLDEIRSVLGPVLADASIVKDAHNAKYDFKVLTRAGLPVKGLGSDTMIAAYLLGQTSIGLKDLAFTRLGVQMVPITELIGKGRTQTTMDHVQVELAAGYAAADVAVTERLRNLFTPQLKSAGLYDLFTDIEMPLVSVLAEMELVGVAIDVPWLQNLSTQIHKEMVRLQEGIYEEAKHPFNINSTQQLGAVLFEELQLPGRKRTQTGYSTDRDVLDSLRGLHPIVDQVIEYRQLIKLKNTYVDALPLLVRSDTGRVHTNFNQTVAATGRLSSSNPNLQNIPIRTEIGRDVRKAFIADNSSKHKLFDEESLLLAADYSQIELRLLAHMAQEERLISAFEADQDIHAATAAEVMGVPIDKVDPDSRRLAKTINFGVLYGMGSYGLARDSGLSQQEAAKFIELYWSRYPAVRRFMDQTLQEGRERGYVSTMLGRRRNAPELLSRNGGIRQQAERMAINAPVQGTAADIIKIAMNRLSAEMKRRNLKSKMLLQVHDELVFEVPRSELEEISDLVCSTMESAIVIDVPLRVEVKAGKNWGEMQPIHVAE